MQFYSLFPKIQKYIHFFWLDQDRAIGVLVANRICYNFHGWSVCIFNLIGQTDVTT